MESSSSRPIFQPRQCRGAEKIFQPTFFVITIALIVINSLGSYGHFTNFEISLYNIVFLPFALLGLIKNCEDVKDIYESVKYVKKNGDYNRNIARAVFIITSLIAISIVSVVALNVLFLGKVFLDPNLLNVLNITLCVSALALQTIKKVVFIE